MSTTQEKQDYYEKRAQDRIKQAGRNLNDAIKAHNQIAILLQDAVNFLNLAAAMSDLPKGDLPQPIMVDPKNEENSIDKK